MSEKKDLSPEKEQLPQPPLIPSLLDDVTVEIVARVPSSCYPTISLVSKGFKKLVASPELHKRRSLLGCNEHRLYAVLRNRSTRELRLYVLHRKLNSSNRLVVVRSLPPMYYRGSYLPSYVPVGSKIYVLNDLDAFSIDCGSHAKQTISDIPQRMFSKVANIVGGKVYVIGDSFCRVAEESGKRWRNALSVFDTETQMWEPVTINQDMFVGALWTDAVVMEDKLYIKCYRKKTSFVYRPNDSEWELDEILNSNNWKHACVVEDVLYYHDLPEKVLRVYDPKQKSWSVVNGLEDFLAAEIAHSRWSKTVNYGVKKLALFFPKYHDDKETICCAEIALERRQGGEIWGKLQCCNVVIDDGLFDMVKCVAVTV